MEIERINELIKSQENDSFEIKRIWENIKKDSSTRKTKTYIEERKTRLQTIIQRAQQNHILLQDQEMLSSHKYITQNFYENCIKKYYDTAIDHLEKCRDKLQKLKDIADISDEDERHVDSPQLFIQKYRIKQFHKKISTAQAAIYEKRPAWHLQALVKSLEKQFQDLEDNHIQLLIEDSTLDDQYFIDGFQEAQDSYEEIINMLQKSINDKEKDGPNKINSTTKLPRIKIPIFTGSYDSWNSFYDLFKKIVDDDCTISTTEKMQYLKTHVQGDAEKLIRHLTVNEVNYKAALTLLTNRYKDERRIAQTFIDKLLDLPKIQYPNAKMLRNMHDSINESLEALKNQNIDISTWDPILSRLVIRKWDQDTNMKYEDQLEEPNKIQKFENIMKFLEKRFKSLESAKPMTTFNYNSAPVSYPQNQNKPITTYNYNSAYVPFPQNNTNNGQERKRICWYCNNEHNIYQCQAFKALNVNDRIKKAQEKQMCYICLMHDTKKECMSQNYRKCEICNKAHSTLLHRNFKEYLSYMPPSQTTGNRSYNHKPTTSKNNTHRTQPKENAIHKITTNASTHETQKTILLATALVQTKTFDGTPQILRVLCDQGSEASLCTEEVAQLLGYPRQKIEAEIKGIADIQPKTSNHMISVTLKPRFTSTYQLTTSLVVLPKLTAALPKKNLEPLSKQHFENKIIADPTYYRRGPVDIILGAEDYSKILLKGFEKLENGIIAQETELGWILSGYCPTENNNGMKILSLVTRANESETQLTKFWELEELTDDYQVMKREDKVCEDYYKETTTRNQDGSYTVRLPFKDPSLEYGNTRQKAAARLIQLEKKLDKNESLRHKYNEFMKEYLDMGHMKEVNMIDKGAGKFYIPHQPVIREDALTTKLRCVFDASSKSDTNISLNDNLHKGPRLQQDMCTILLRWRKHKIAFMADIEKMYRFIKIHTDDQCYQRILWRWSTKQVIQEYELTTVTYGTTAAPYLAIKTLQQLAIDEQQRYPIASQATLHDFYVDDILSGENDLGKAKILQDQLIKMLQAGGFNLRKWSSNSAEILANVQEDNVDDKMIKLPQDETRKSLGVNWLPKEDNFRFNVTITTNSNPTKRFIFSEIAKLFDPLGWLQPVIITMKLLIQEIWMSEIEWNKPVPEAISKKWTVIQQQLKCLENIKIPRWISYETGAQVELHGFSDASEKAYGAVVYSRIKINDTYHISLLQAKSKVAPKKHKTTLPRLELCAAVLLTKLITKINTAMDFKDASIWCWTDSMITLGWIRGEADKWQTFVANRVSEVQRTLPHAKWNHIVSADNPADVISRGIEPSKLKDYDLWWNGPKWLHSDQLVTSAEIIPEPDTEIKHCHNITTDIKSKDDVIKRFSSFSRMVRVLSYCLRFIRRQKTEKQLTYEEIDSTRKQIILQAQREAFEQEYKILKQKQTLKNNNKLSSLDPFIDEDGLIRVGGRLQHSELPYDQKHPILLPNNHHVTKILIHDAHLKTLHGGNRLTLAYLRQQYWVLGGKRAVKGHINKCVKCIRYKAETAKQKMGALPKPRVTQSQPFSHTGCDFAGPVQVRAMKGRGHKSYKGYIAVFICLATKAIHLELVGDLSTESFIAALRRFMARRGHVSHMYTDNATNFVGAANFLHKEILQITQSPQFQNDVTDIGTQWHFIPPNAPHFGGIWEAGVKSMKHHLRRVIGDSTLTFEELSTFLCQIEACLNSRPICIQSENIYDNIVLTPSHFLIGREAIGVPDPMSNINTDLINKWKHIQKMKKDFWNSWTKEYLHQLQQRYKWKIGGENLKIGTVVLVKEDNISPSRWPIARVKEIHPGSDGTTRVVTLERSQGADQKRAVHSLIPLPVTENIEINENETKTPIQTNAAMITRRETMHNKKSKGKLCYWFVMLMTLLQVFAPARAAYTIRNLEPGLYIEEMGNATIDRGTFRLEMSYERSILDQNLQKTRGALKQFKELCDYTIAVDSETHCIQYYQHLKEEVEKFNKTHEYLTEIRHTRKKRGFMGMLMTSIFGVNDEVYRDINTLQNNQQKLIDAANHQTKFMISTISAVNETEAKIEAKLEKFRTKLNQVLTYINNNNVWYRSINSNHVKIQVMQSYQLAYNYITEIQDYYAGLMEIYLAKATVYSVITPKHVTDLINSVNSKLPPNLKVIQTQLINTRLAENETHIRVLSYFPIAEKAKFTLLHVTPIPVKHQDGSFQNLDISQSIIAIDYNNELYFELTNEEFKNCLHRYNNFICFPVAVKNMQLNQNCIVRLITKNDNITACSTRPYNITHNIIWKQVQMSNTWIYLTKNTESVSIVCDGEREEVSIHDVGIIQISENCILKTITTTLYAKRIISVNVLASYSRITYFNLDNNRLSSSTHNVSDIPIEQVLDSSKDIFNKIANNERNLQTTLSSTVWGSITVQSYVASFSTILAFSVIFLLIYCFGPQIARRLRTKMGSKKTAVAPAPTSRPDPVRPNTAPPTPPAPHAQAARTRPHQDRSPELQLYEMKTFSTEFLS